MYLLGRAPAPDHATIARFRSERLTNVVEDLFSQLIRLLAEAGELSLCSVFIDKSDIGKRENMPYDAENDVYICHAGHKIQAAYEKKTDQKQAIPL